jgi:hypothetical protein
MAARVENGFVESVGAVDLGDANAGAGASRFDKDRPAQFGRLHGHARTLRLPCAGVDQHVPTHGQPMGGEDELHVVLIHPHGGREYARTHVRNTG